MDNYLKVTAVLVMLFGSVAGWIILDNPDEQLRYCVDTHTIVFCDAVTEDLSICLAGEEVISCSEWKVYEETDDLTPVTDEGVIVE